MNRAIQITYFLLRVVSGFLFFEAGAAIVLGWFGGMPSGGQRPSLTSQIGIGGILELVGGLAIMFGLCTRPIAFIASGEMAVAYWQFHAPRALWPAQNQGIPAILFCFIFLFMAAYGPGDWSLDALLKRKREAALKDAAVTKSQ